jgi:UDP:flavonoid glycosyltransferase YjiC (YdhE family)
MTILNIPYFSGGLSHMLPLLALNNRYNKSVNSYFLVHSNLQTFLKRKGVSCVPIDYFGNETEHIDNRKRAIEYVIKKEQEAYEKIKPTLIVEDCSLTSPLIAEKNNVPRISIQRTGFFRSIDESYRNPHHVHSMEKADSTQPPLANSTETVSEVLYNSEIDQNNFKRYRSAKAKIIPGIPSIECLPDDIENRRSYFYSGPLIVKDQPSRNLLIRLGIFFELNKNKPVVFVTTGTIDKTPVEKYIEYLAQHNYAVVTTNNCQIKEEYKQNVFHNTLLPLDYICKISDLVIHQCGSGIYHYPIMTKTAFLTIGTQCYDREDIAQRLQKLGVSGHIPHPDDNPDYWNIFTKLMNKFKENTLTDYSTMDKLKNEVNRTIANFRMEEVIKYALAQPCS